jgi:Ca2+/Na+ antiporter
MRFFSSLSNSLLNSAPVLGVVGWFVLWREAAEGALLSCGLGWALTALLVASAVCVATTVFCGAFIAPRITAGGAAGRAVAGWIHGMLLLALAGVASFVSVDWLMAALTRAETPAAVAGVVGTPAYYLTFALWIAAAAAFVWFGWRKKRAFDIAALALFALPVAVLAVLIFKTAGGVPHYGVLAAAARQATAGSVGDVFGAAFLHVLPVAIAAALVRSDFSINSKFEAVLPAAAIGAVNIAVVLIVAGALRYSRALPELVGNTDPLHPVLLRTLLDYRFVPWFTALIALTAFPSTCAFALAGIRAIRRRSAF